MSDDLREIEMDDPREKGELRLVFVKNDIPWGGLVTLKELNRILSYEERVGDKKKSVRVGEPWEDWEDKLLIDKSLTDEEIAERTQRHVSGVQTRRKMALRIADAEKRRLERDTPLERDLRQYAILLRKRAERNIKMTAGEVLLMIADEIEEGVKKK